MSFSQQGGGGIPPIRAATVMGPNGRPVPLIHISSQRRPPDSPLSSPPVGGIVTASSVAFPFDLDPNDPILQQNHAPESRTESHAQQQLEASAPSQQDQQDSSTETEASDNNKNNDDDDDMSISSSSSSEQIMRRRKVSRVATDEADSSDDEQLMQSTLRAAPAKKAASGVCCREESTAVPPTDAARERPLPQDNPNASDSVDGPSAGDEVASRKKAPELLEQAESREKEEEELLSKVDDDILAEEEKALLAKIERSIDAAQAAVLPVGACVLSIGYPEGEGSNIRVREEIVQNVDNAKRPKKRRKVSRKHAGDTPIIDVFDWSTRVSVTKKLPKVLGQSPPLELTNTVFRTEIVEPILARDPQPRRRLTGLLSPIEEDPYSLTLEMRGHPDVIRKVMDKTTAFIRSFQSPQSEKPPATGKSQSESMDAAPEAGKAEDTPSKALLKPPPASVAYRHFQEKYSEAVDLEYKGAVHLQSVWKYMWASHKKHLGARCDPHCTCVSKLSSITEDVVANFMTAQIKKDPSWKNERGLRERESPVGFVSHFAPKFYPLLAEQFQDENPQQLLNRLVLMFKLHRRERRYGVTCRDDCPCGEGWDIVFKMGHLRPGEKKDRAAEASLSRSLVIPRKQSSAAIPRKESGSTSQKESVATMPRLSLKRKTSERDVSAVSLSRVPSTQRADATMRKANPEDMAIPRKSRTPQAEPAPSAGPSDPKAYVVDYDACELLGFHCITELKRGQPVCIIDSVSPQGQAKDSRLQVGTVVMSAATETMTTPTSILTYKDLKLIFERAQNESSRLHVYFINTFVKKKGTLGSILSQTKHSSLLSSGGLWSTNNVWHGTKAGWAGGAPSRGFQDRKSLQPKQSQAADESRSLGMGQKVLLQRAVPVGVPVIHLSEGRQTEKPTLQRYVWRNKMSQALHRRHTKPPSILKAPRYKMNSDDEPGSRPVGVVRSLIGSALPPPSNKSANKSVRFPEACVQKMYFNDNDLAYRLGNLATDDYEEGDIQIDNATRQLELPEEELPTIPTREQLFDAVQNKTAKDVILLLERGAPFEEPDERGMTAKDIAKAMEAELGPARGDPLIRQKLNDISEKKKALSIYVTARFAIDQARFLKAWVEFQLKFDGLRNLVLTRVGTEHRSSNKLYCRATLFIVGERGEHEIPLRDLPPETLNESVDWNKQVATVTFNPNVDGARSRCLAITLEKGNSTDPSGPVRLGRLEIPLSRLHEESRFDMSSEIVTNFSSSEYLQSATIIMHVKKCHLKDTARDRKKKEAAKKLKETVEWIRRFNENSYLNNSGASIKGHIAPEQCQFTSILHGAVFVSDVAMVETLLRLGADPLSRSVDGSAQKLASTIAEKLASTRLGGAEEEEDENEDDKTALSHDVVEDSSHPSVAIVRILTNATKEKSSDSSSLDDLTRPEPASDAVSDEPPDNEAPPFDSEQSSAIEARGRSSAQSSSQELENLEHSTNTDVPEMDADLRVPKKRKQAGTSASAMPGSLRQDERSSPSIPRDTSPSQASEIDRPSGHHGAPRLASDDALPGIETVPSHWTLEKDQEICRYFRTPAGCKFGLECNNAHAKLPVGHPLKDEQLTRGLTVPALNPSFTRYRESTDQNGQKVVTAAYVDLYENITYYAEGGKTVGRNRHGVNWYKSKDDAYAALYQVLVYWKNDLDKTQGRRPIGGSQGPVWEPPRRELGSGGGSQSQGPVWEPPRRELGSSAGYHQPVTGRSIKPKFGEEVYFDRLRRSNLANIYTQVFSHLPHLETQMRKNWWTEYNLPGGTVAVQLKLPDNARVADANVFNSWEVGGGVIIEGRAYHKDLKSAKASAFFYLLVKAAEAGLISQDMTLLADGKPLSLGFS